MPDGSRRLRRKWISDRLAQLGYSAAVFLDDESHRDPGLRWLCGQPGDGVLVIRDTGESVLAAWDAILAARMADADRVVPYTEYGRTLKGFLARILPELGIPRGSAVELPPSTTMIEFGEIASELKEWEFLCPPEGGAASLLENLRSVKDKAELEIYGTASSITDTIIEELCAGLESGEVATEADAAILIERRSRDLGAEGTGFETLAAGPARSWGIHAFPAWGAGPFGTAGPLAGGLSILDFGIKLDGYTTDVTLGIARGKLDAIQEEMLRLVEDAYATAEAACRPGASVRDPARACDAVFSAAGWSMPHSLGHGIGLEAHESPILKDREGNDWIFMPGMVFTLEPGLYHPEKGGIRLENDFLMTEKGPQRLTGSRILRLG